MADVLIKLCYPLESHVLINIVTIASPHHMYPYANANYNRSWQIRKCEEVGQLFQHFVLVFLS